MGFTASYRDLHDENACFIILRNESLYPSVASVGVFSILYGISNYYIPRIAIATDTIELKEYVGSYKLDDTQNYEINLSIKSGLLHSLATGGLEDNFYKERKDNYFIKSYDCEFVFIRNSKGEVTGIKGYLAGKSYNYKKIN